ncbi:MAG: methyltransferase domain-containing protein [Bacteroidota bacterium]|nr:methyltransferase domain-containing protein [Bacteroidota bacterium]
MNFKQRSYQQELLDRTDIPFEDIRRNMQELNTINTWLGGHAVTLLGFRQLVGKKKEIHVCEIGCGGGDNLMTIFRWCRKHSINVQLTGIDINPFCIEVATTRLAETGASLICSDYKTALQEGTKADIIFSSLFCHHFPETELRGMLTWMQRHSRQGFFINDLHRHFLAYYSIKFITAVCSRSYLVKNDAPLSVRRGFSRGEWRQLCAAAGINASIEWKWAFRWLICSKN